MTKAGLLFGAALALTVTAAPGQEIDSGKFHAAALPELPGLEIE
jgi:hypothetical protein